MTDLATDLVTLDQEIATFEQRRQRLAEQVEGADVRSKNYNAAKLVTTERELHDVSAELARLQERRAEAQAAHAHAQREQAQRDGELAGLRAEWARLQDVTVYPTKSLEVGEWLARVSHVHARLVELTGEAPPTFQIDPIAAYAPILEAQERQVAEQRAALVASWGPVEEDEDEVPKDDDSELLLID